MEAKSGRKNSSSWQWQNFSVSASGVQWVADELQRALPNRSVELLPRISQPNLLVSDVRGSDALITPYVGICVKTAAAVWTGKGHADSCQFGNRSPHLLPQSAQALFVYACPSHGYVWVRDSAYMRLRSKTVRMYVRDATDIATAAQMIGNMVETNDNLARFSKSEWVRRSCRGQGHFDRGRSVLSQILQFPVFEELKFCGDRLADRHDATLRGRKLLCRVHGENMVVSLVDGRKVASVLSVNDEIDALLIFVADIVDPNSLRHIGLLPKSVLLARGFLAVDGEGGKSALWVRRDLNFTGTMMEGLEPYFLDVANASTADFEDFFQKILGS